MHTWSTHQLTEFLASLSLCEDESLAVRIAVEQAAAAIDAEVGALVQEGRVRAAIGFPENEMPEAQLLGAAAGERDELVVAGFVPCRTLTARVEGVSSQVLVLARSGDGGFDADEVNLVRGMARVLGLTLRMLSTLSAERTLRQERERSERLLERLFALQRKISQRAPLQEVLDAVVMGAAELLGDEIVALRLIDTDQPKLLRITSVVGIDEALLRHARHSAVGEGVGGKAVAEDRLVLVEQDGDSALVGAEFADDGVQAAMAAPVHEGGRVIGSLCVGSRRPGRGYDAEAQELLGAFAGHASLALNDAKTLDQMHQAFHDSLTGLPNRALFIDRLEHALVRAGRRHARIAVLFIDLDGFKMVNDSLGHGAGDALLTEVGARLKQGIRGADTAARLGGDEFALLLEGYGGAAELSVIAERVIDAIKQPIFVGDREVFVNASVGIAVSTSAKETAGELLRNADVAMYRAKRQGEGCCATFEPVMHADVLRRLELEADLRRALENDEFLVYYQPIVELRTGRPLALEALVRWCRADGSIVPPADFIPAAEESGLIADIDKLVLERACMQLHDWRHELAAGTALGVNVNVSARRLLSRDLVHEVEDALARAELDPQRLTLEITETVLMQDVQTALRRLQGLRELGVRIAIDDFGTGYSSLAYLRRFSVDMIKIDRSFVKRLDDPNEAALVRAIIMLGDALNLSLVVEGIEEAGQAERLLALGCDHGQGFLFARPEPAEEALPVLRPWSSARAA